LEVSAQPQLKKSLAVERDFKDLQENCRLKETDKKSAEKLPNTISKIYVQ
jgi:hypothetical protein